MAHLEKYTVAAAGHLTAHYERRKYNGEYIKFGNQNIDISRTPQNYNIGPVRDMSQIDFIRQRTGEVICMKRKDVNVMCDWVVTAPVGVQEKELEKFFNETYTFLEKRYGSQNVISAHVHMDEVTPHIHFAFVPVVYDSKKDAYKVSAKEVISRKDLQSFHPDLERHLSRVFGREVGILNDATKEGNRSVQELKMQSAVERMKDAEDRIRVAEDVYQEKIKSIRKVIEDSESHKKEIETMSTKLDEISNKIAESIQLRGKLEIEINRIEMQVKFEQDKLKHFHNMVDGCEISVLKIQNVQPQKTVTGTIKGITLEDISNLKKTAMLYHETLEQLRYSRKKCEWYETEVERLKRNIPSYDERIQIERDMKELQILRKAFSQLPDEIRKEVLKVFKPEKKQRKDWRSGKETEV